jgi:hypothetical protein
MYFFVFQDAASSSSEIMSEALKSVNPEQLCNVEVDIFL